MNTQQFEELVNSLAGELRRAASNVQHVIQHGPTDAARSELQDVQSDLDVVDADLKSLIAALEH